MSILVILISNIITKLYTCFYSYYKCRLVVDEFPIVKGESGKKKKLEKWIFYNYIRDKVPLTLEVIDDFELL